MLTLFDDSIFDTSIVHSKENKPENQDQLDNNKAHFNKQCKKVFDLLMSGKVINQLSARDYQIADFRRRVIDLRTAGFKVSEEKIPGAHGLKRFHMSDEDRKYNKKFL